MYYFLPLYIFLLQFICQLKQFISCEISGSLGSECEDGSDSPYDGGSMRL
jgi:hypothetical protein